MVLKQKNMYKIYHNSRCSKSRAGLKYLESKTSDIEIIPYLKEETAFTEDLLAEVLKKMNKKPMDIIRTHEALYKSDYKGKEFSDKEWIKILVENPRLIHRPIIVKDNKAVLGNPPEEIDIII